MSRRYLPGDPHTLSENEFTETEVSEEVSLENVGFLRRAMARLKGEPLTEADRARALRQAIRDQDVNRAENLLSGGVDLFEEQEASLLCIAARRQNLAMVDLLLRAGVDVNQADHRGSRHKSRTPLMEAARRGWTEGVDALLSAGAKTGILDEVGASALHLAVRASRVEVVELLLRNGADPNPPRGKGPTLSCVHEAASLDILRLLIEHGAHPDLPDRAQMTPLHFHARTARLEVLRMLLELGADPNARDKHGRTPAFYIGQKGNGLATLNLLVEHGADLAVRDKENNTCTHLICARADQTALFERLAELCPQNFHTTNHAGETPRDILSVRGHRDLALGLAVTVEERRARGEFIEPEAVTLFTGPGERRRNRPDPQGAAS